MIYRSTYLLTFQIAAAAAVRHEKINPNLGSKQMSDTQVKSIFTNSINRGNATYASKFWLEEVKKMYGLFNAHHPKVKVTKFQVIFLISFFG